MTTPATDTDFVVPGWVPARIAELFERPLIRKLWKYSMTSVFGVVVGQSLLFFFASILDWPGVAANVTAVCITTVPTFFLSKHWVWSKSGKPNLYAEVIPFWVMSFLGLVLSSLCIWWLERQWPGNKLLVNVGNAMGYGSLWVAKFLILDRVLFKVTHEHPEGPAPLI